MCFACKLRQHYGYMPRVKKSVALFNRMNRKILFKYRKDYPRVSAQFTQGSLQLAFTFFT